MKQKKHKSLLESGISALISFFLVYPILSLLDGHVSVMVLTIVIVGATATKNYTIRRYFDHE